MNPILFGSSDQHPLTQAHFDDLRDLIRERLSEWLGTDVEVPPSWISDVQIQMRLQKNLHGGIPLDDSIILTCVHLAKDVFVRVKETNRKQRRRLEFALNRYHPWHHENPRQHDHALKHNKVPSFGRTSVYSVSGGVHM